MDGWFFINPLIDSFLRVLFDSEYGKSEGKSMFSVHTCITQMEYHIPYKNVGLLT